MKKVEFDIQGMTCSSCSAHVERAVKKLDGINKVNVNLLSNNMIVEYDEEKINNETIIKAVTEEGYGARLSENRKQKADKTIKDNTIKSMKKRLTISIVFLIPLVYLAMHNMFYEWFGLPIPQIVKNTFHGTKNIFVFAFSQLLLLIPIVYVNRNYFTIGFKRLFKGTPNMDSLIAISSTASILYGIFSVYILNSRRTIFRICWNDTYINNFREILRNKIKRKNE